MIGMKLLAASAVVMTALACTPALAQNATGGNGSDSGQPTGKAASDKRANAADPTGLIDPNRAAAAIIVRTTRDFNSVRVMPLSQSGNSQALIRAVLDYDAGLEGLHDAIRGNRAIMTVLNAHGVAVADVVAVTTDRNDNAIVFTRR